MLTGLKGVKYGLQPGAKPKSKPVLQKPINVFGDDDDDGDIGNDIARQAAKKQNDKKVTQMHAAALAEDASVFDYDGVYDSIQEARVQPKQQEKLARKSRYIGGLLDKAEERKREQDIIYERTLLKERAAEDHLFGDKDKFVTAAYKAKLEEDQKWLAAERIREARDAKADAVKAGHMGNFYRNVMTNNAAFGTAQPAAAAPARLATASDPSATADAPAAAVDPAFEAARRAREAYEAAKERTGAAVPAAAPEDARATASKPERGSERAGEGGDKKERGAASRERDTAGPSSRDRQGGEAAILGAEDDKRESERGAAGVAQSTGGAEPPVAAAAAAAGKPPEEDKEAKAAAARERFLARKRKAPIGPG